MCKNKDYSLWSMVIFWPVSGTAYFPVLKSFPFIRQGSKRPSDFPFQSPLNKETAPSVSVGIPMVHVSLGCPSLARQVGSAPQLRDPLLPSLVIEPPKHSPASLSWELLSSNFNGKNWRETLLTSVLLFLPRWQESFQMVDRYWISVRLSHARCKARLIDFTARGSILITSSNLHHHTGQRQEL